LVDERQVSPPDLSWFNPTLSRIDKRKSTLADFVFHLVNCVTAPKEGCNQRERTADATDVWFHRYWKSGRHPSGPLVIEVLKHEAADKHIQKELE
jgi:hypothetical protein